MDELHGIITTYEMGVEKNPSKKEASFKHSKRTKNKEQKSSGIFANDAKNTHLVKKLKKGYEKYKGMFPFKCFNCDQEGHFSTKCPYGKNESSDDVGGSIVALPTMSAPHPLASVSRLAELGRLNKSVQLTYVTDQTIM